MADKQHTDDRPLPFVTLTAALRHHAVHSPDATAVTAGSEEVTYSQLLDRVESCAGWLAARSIVAGDRVVMVGHNTVAWIVHYLAVLSIEAVVAPANNRLNPQQLADQVAALDAKLVLVDEAHASVAAQVSDDRLAVLDDSNESDPIELPSPACDAAGLISFTSGTTGRPKGATLTQGALAEASWAFVRVLGTDATDSTLVVVPMFHNTGFVDQFGHMLMVGGRTDLLYKYRTSSAVDALKARPVTYLAAVPSIIRLIMLADGAEIALASLRTLLYGGSAMPAAWIEELLTKWPKVRLFHGYGLTEYGSAVSFLPPDFAREAGESIGFAVPFTTIRIVGEDLADVPEGAVGELWCQGPTMMREYWGQPDLTAEKIHDGWLRTGDLARREDGLYYIEGRVDDVINRGGEKILPAHVESLLSQLHEVADSCVVGIPDSILQSRVVAAIEARPGTEFEEAAALASLQKHLPDYAVPERVIVLKALPRGASGKVDRRAVAEQLVSDGHVAPR